MIDEATGLSAEALTDEYLAIVGDLDPLQTQIVWLAALFGRRPPSAELAERVARLNALRDRVGRTDKTLEHSP